MIMSGAWMASLPARTDAAGPGLAGQGGGHLPGCYADLDGVELAVAVAGRGHQERTGHDNS
jgi:hypothetical protein